jgi:hypothetical protein
VPMCFHIPPVPITLLLADDSDVARRAIKLLLEAEPSVELVGEAVCFADVIRMCAVLKPDVLVMDLRMRDERGLGPASTKAHLTPYSEHASPSERAMSPSFRPGVKLYDGDINSQDCGVQLGQRAAPHTNDALLSILPRLRVLCFPRPPHRLFHAVHFLVT